MNKTFGLFVVVTITLSAHARLFEQLTYQDIIVNNMCVQKGERQCVFTYNIIKKVLNTIKKPFSVLDIGAAQGYFSFKIAYDYSALCVMLEGSYNYKNHVNQLLKICQLNQLPNTIFLQTRISPVLLNQLAEYEHFDVVLAFNFIHHCGYHWKEMAEAIFKLGNTIIIEHPPYNEFQNLLNPEWIKRKAITDYLLQIGAKVIGEVPRHTSATKKTKVYCLKNYTLPSSLSLKQSTFKTFAGVYPSLASENSYVK